MTKHCKKCGKGIGEDVEFCEHCGAKLGKIEKKEVKTEKAEGWSITTKAIIGTIAVIAIALVVGLVLITQPSFLETEPTTSEPLCAANYFWTGSECCYDIDSNSICDNEQEIFRFFLECDWQKLSEKYCVDSCEAKCAEVGKRMAVGALHGSDLSSYFRTDGFQCNCVPYDWT